MKGCETGCKPLTGGEIYHHKNCQYYPGSMSEELDALRIIAGNLSVEIRLKHGCQHEFVRSVFCAFECVNCGRLIKGLSLPPDSKIERPTTPPTEPRR
jgi:hypothetical protein